MQQESEYDLLRAKLDTLDASDLTGNWNSSETWQRLEGRLPAKPRMSGKLWAYCGAAAAALVIGIFIFSNDPEHEVTGLNGAYSKANTFRKEPAVAKMATPPLPDTARVPGAIVARQKDKPAVKLQDQRPANEQTAQEEISLVANAQQPAAPLPVKQSFPEPVYTLDEIRSNVPENAAPPRIYTGIFGLKTAPANAPDDDEQNIRPRGFLHKN